LKRIVDSGELGDLYYISTMRLNLGLFQRDLNVLWDLAPHDISILLYLLDREPISVSASGSAHILEGIQDIAFLCLRFPGDVMAHTRVSWLDPRKERTVTVVGSKKMAVYDDVASSEKIKIYDKGVEKPPYTDSYGEFQLQYHHGDIIVPYISITEPLRLQCQHFIDCVANGTRPQSDGWDGLAVIRVLEAAERSLRNGGTQESYRAQEEVVTWPQ
jgi:predicted dehydrogenase